MVNFNISLIEVLHNFSVNKLREVLIIQLRLDKYLSIEVSLIYLDYLIQYLGCIHFIMNIALRIHERKSMATCSRFCRY